MKKLLCVTIALLCTATMQAQEEEKDVTKFLGIQVDGYKPAMIEKLKAKGFTSTTWDKDVLEGEFNGTEVLVSVWTNNNKVYRIYLIDKYKLNETDIKIRFNNLCRQFGNNPKYMPITDKELTIPDDEDISYEMTVKNKSYDARFYQISLLDSAILYNESKYSSVQSRLFSQLEQYTWEQQNNPTEETKEKVIQIQYLLNNHLNKSVHFMILESAGKYRIGMAYSNGYNKADGEDL